MHVLTEKGLGYEPAERDEADRFHAVGVIDPETGEPARRRTLWTDVFADEIVALGDERHDVVGITAAMLDPVGLDRVRRGVPGPRLRRRHRRAARRHLRGRPGDRRPAPGRRRLRDVPQPRVRPGADGRRPARCRRHLRARPGRRHRRRRRQPPRHVGPVDPARSCPASGSPRPRDGAPVRELLREAVDVDDGPTVLRLPEGTPARRHPGPRPGRRRRRPAPHAAARTSSWSPSVRWPRSRSTSPSGSPHRASGSPSSTRAGCCRSTRPSSSWPRPPAGRRARGQRPGRRGRRRAARRSPTTGCARAVALRHPAAVPGPRRARAILDRIGLNADHHRGVVERFAAEGHEPLPITEKASRD